MSLRLDIYDWKDDVLETIDFWDMSIPPSEYFFGHDEENPKAIRLDQIWEDYHRLQRQLTELCELRPEHATKYQADAAAAIAILEAEVVAMKLNGMQTRTIEASITAL